MISSNSEIRSLQSTEEDHQLAGTSPLTAAEEATTLCSVKRHQRGISAYVSTCENSQKIDVRLLGYYGILIRYTQHSDWRPLGECRVN
jgi:hypothetical protein